MCCMAVLQVPNRSLAAAKEGAAKATVDVLNSYRRNCSEQSAPGQLVLPEALKLAPLYNLALSKCPAFRWTPSIQTVPLQRCTSLHPLMVVTSRSQR